MADAPASPTERIAQLEAKYQARFAGHPRISRDAEELEEMLQTAKALADEVAPLGDVALSERVQTAVDMYTAELEQVKKIQSMPGAVQEARLRMWADLGQSRYRRHFAGQDRRTRDPLLLQEIRGDVRQWRGEMEVLHERVPSQLLEDAIQTATKNLVLFKKELDLIRSNRASGTLAEQATRLAQLANTQLEAYRTHFAGKPRVSRRPKHLERLTKAITELRDAMSRLEQRGHVTEENRRNIALLTDRISQWTEELGHIREARKEATVEQRMGALAQGANEWFQQYRDHFAGQSRETRDLAKLTVILEGLWQTAREMDDLDRTEGDDVNERNLRLVTDNLRLYSKEWDAIRQARSADA